MDKLPVGDIQKTIGYTFKNKKLLLQAFIRSSYSQEHPEVLDNEKLEFYGDEALDYYVTRAMAKQFSEITKDGQFKSRKSEQELTEIKSYNVDTDSLSHCIWITGFQNYLFMGESDIKNNVQNSPSVMADLFEAIIGAVAIDSDWNYEDISNACKNMLKLLNFDTNYIKWVNKWCADQGYNEPIYRPNINFLAMQLKRNNYGLGLTSGINNFYQTPSFFSEPSDITGAYLIIKELDLKVESELTLEYAAYMDCAKKAYDIIHIREMNLAVGKPTRDTAVNQLNILAQKGFIEKPDYSFNEEHDENGNPIWHCTCDLEELDEVYYGDSPVKKEAKKEAAYGALGKVLGYMPEELELETDFADEEDL